MTEVKNILQPAAEANQISASPEVLSHLEMSHEMETSKEAEVLHPEGSIQATGEHTPIDSVHEQEIVVNPPSVNSPNKTSSIGGRISNLLKSISHNIVGIGADKNPHDSKRWQEVVAREAAKKASIVEGAKNPSIIPFPTPQNQDLPPQPAIEPPITPLNDIIPLTPIVQQPIDQPKAA